MGSGAEAWEAGRYDMGSGAEAWEAGRYDMGSGAEAWEAGLLQAPAAMSSPRRPVRRHGNRRLASLKCVAFDVVNQRFRRSQSMAAGAVHQLAAS